MAILHSCLNQKDRDAFDNFTLEHLSVIIHEAMGIPLVSISSITNSKGIGDVSNGVTAQYTRQGEIWQSNMLAFRVGDIGAWVFIDHKAIISSPVSIITVSRAYADSILRPEIPCRLTSVEPVVGADFPEYAFTVGGFYPNEELFISLSGNLLIGGEIKSSSAVLIGGDREIVDNNGQATEMITFTTSEQLDLLGNAELPSGPQEYILNVTGASSGCVIEQIVTWTGELGLETTPEPPSSQPEATSSTSNLFREDFDQQFEEGWEWRNELEGGWNLIERPGFLRVEVPLNAKQFLVRNAPEGNFEITTRVLFRSNQNFQQAGLIILHDDDHMLMFHRGYAFFPDADCCIGNALYYDNHDKDLGVPEAGYAIDPLSPTKTDELGEAYLRLTRVEKTYTAYYSDDGENWTTVGRHEVAWDPVYVGIQTRGDQNSTPKNADFDYFTLETLP